MNPGNLFITTVSINKQFVVFQDNKTGWNALTHCCHYFFRLKNDHEEKDKRELGEYVGEYCEQRKRWMMNTFPPFLFYSEFPNSFSLKFSLKFSIKIYPSVKKRVDLPLVCQKHPARSGDPYIFWFPPRTQKTTHANHHLRSPAKPRFKRLNLTLSWNF